VVGALAVMGTAAVNSASDLQQATGAVESVFGAYADEVKKFAADAATNVGLAESQYSQLASVLGAQLKNMGIPMEDVAGQTDDLIGLGADLAATFGGTTADAVSALSSLMRGERDPIEQFGVSIKQADIDAQKAAMGLAGLTGEADKNADTTATLALLYQQTADAAGQFAEESGTLAGQQQIANASWESAVATLGTALLPAVTAVSTAFAGFATWVQENSTLVLVLAGVIGGLAAAILIVNVALSAYQAIALIATAAQWLWNVAMAANPIGLVVIAIGLLIAIIIVMIVYWDEIIAVLADVWEAFMNSEVGQWFQDVFGAIGDWWNDLVDSFQNGFDQIVGWIQDVIGWFQDLFGAKDKAEQAAAAPKAAPSGVAVVPTSSPTLFGARAAGWSGAAAGPRTAGVPVTTGAPITINVSVPPGGQDAAARAIRRELEKLGRRNNGVTLRPVVP